MTRKFIGDDGRKSVKPPSVKTDFKKDDLFNFSDQTHILKNSMPGEGQTPFSIRSSSSNGSEENKRIT